MSELLDSLIYTGIILLVLSQVSEKLTTFIRSYLKVTPFDSKTKSTELDNGQKFRYFIYRGIFGLLKFLLILDERKNRDPNESVIAKNKKKEVHSDKEKTDVDFGITKLSILIGVLLALAFHANLFLIVGNDAPHEVLSWKYFSKKWSEEEVFSNIWLVSTTILGCFCTGFLLSFGSKFFHDLLEILYEFKQAKRTLNDPYTYASTDFKTAIERISSPANDPVLVVLDRHKDILIRKFPNIVSIERMFDQQGNSYLEIRLSEATHEEEIRDKYNFNYLGVNGDMVLPKTRVKVIPNSSQVVPHMDIKMGVGLMIRMKSTNLYGTLGFYATYLDKNLNTAKKAFVTCAHVVNSEGLMVNDENQVIVRLQDGTEKPVGTLYKTELHNWMDGAIITLNEDFEPFNYDWEMDATAKEPRALGWNEKGLVWANGATSAQTPGVIVSKENAVPIKYGDAIITMYDLIRVSSLDYKDGIGGTSITKGGDSGSMLYDDAMRPIGIVIAGSTEFTYAIPITRVLEWFDLTFLPGKRPDSTEA
jgi:hypothetical protein